MRNMQYDKSLVIGNGFDLALGLKTSYPDFMKWLSNKHYMDDAYLYRYLSSKLNQQRWIDMNYVFTQRCSVIRMSRIGKNKKIK